MTVGKDNVGASVLTVGLDLGDRYSQVAVLDGEGDLVEEARIPTTKKGLESRFSECAPVRIALEAGTHSGWVSRLLAGFGHEVLVANPRKLRLIYESNGKDDRADAEHLARLARVDPQLLSPIRHRTKERQADLALLRSRDALVKVRTELVNCARGLVKAEGGRLPGCSTGSFPRKAAPHVPPEVAHAVLPLLEQVAVLTAQIRSFDRQVEELATKKYPETGPLRTVPGVGSLTALAYVLTVEDPGRFRRSRVVGAYFGLTPRRQESGQQNPQLRITKAGDGTMRRLLVGSAQYALGPFGPETELRRWGLSIAARGGKNGKKRAVVAVARKLAVLLHRLWVTGEAFDPRRGSLRAEVVSA